MPSADGVTPEGHNDTTVLIVGGGFSGIATLYRCRKLGLSAKILEKGENFGGVWHWNRYPGARVDSEWPMYQLNIPEAYDTWTFRERFPDHYELREYIAHLDKTLGLSKDTIFGAEVVDAAFDTTRTRWSVLTASGLRLSAKYLVLATGLLHKAYVPKFPGFADYRGHVVHSTSWPEDLDCKGKKIGVVGSGATAVQVVQELAKATADGGSLTVMMKRPSTCVPLQQQQLSVQEQNKWKGWFETLFDAGRKSFTGFPLANTGQNACDVSKEELDARLQMLWQRGAFNFLLGGYRDTSYNPKSNRAVYDFWASKVRSRISDPVKRDIMAPLEPLYPIGGKRPPLEIDYYECLDMGHVEIVSLLSNPIEKFVEDGVVLQDGTHRQLDIVALATGFDSYTGSLCQMGLKDKHGKELKDIWADGVSTYLGICMNGFPNAFIIYSPQAPTAFSNGPTILECQADLVVDTIARLEREKAKSIEATASAAEEWGRETEKTLQGSLTANTDSWWNGGNIPGKKKQVLVYNAGIASYESICQKKLGTWEGFEICK